MPDLERATPDFLDSAPQRVVTEATVSAPIDAVWSLLVDQASWVQWFDAMTSVEASPWIWSQPGQTRKVTVNGFKVSEAAIAVDQEEEYAFTITNWPLPTAVRAAEAVRVADRTDGGAAQTLITYIGAFEPTALGKRLGGVLEKQLIGAWGPAFVQLGELANARRSDTGAPTHG